MKLRNKMILTILQIMILTLFALFIITEGIVAKSFLDLEKNYVLIEGERLINGFDSTMKKLDSILADWAHWDDTYEFINDEYPKYIERNVVDSTFIDSEIEYMIILDKDYELKLSRGYNTKEERYMDVPHSLIENVKGNVNHSGLFWIDDSAIVMSVIDIQDSNGVKEPQGSMAFAFNFDHSVIKAIEEKYKTNINIVHGVDLSPDTGISINKIENSSIAAFQIPYLNINKAMKVEVIVPNSISELGKKTTVIFMTFVALVLFIISLILIIYLRREVTNRLSKLSEDVFKITHSEDLGKRLEIHGDDEISDLKNDINFMLDKIEFMNIKVRRSASIDNMTGTLNRRAGYEELERILKTRDNPSHSLCVAYIDINNLKITNDNYGHQAGDSLIKDVIKILKNNLRDSDKISRLGGDEFLIIFPEMEYDAAVRIFERIEESIKDFNAKSLRPYYIGISKGIAVYDYDMTADEFIEVADKRMYTDKQRSKKGR